MWLNLISCRASENSHIHLHLCIHTPVPPDRLIILMEKTSYFVNFFWWISNKVVHVINLTTQQWAIFQFWYPGSTFCINNCLSLPQRSLYSYTESHSNRIWYCTNDLACITTLFRITREWPRISIETVSLSLMSDEIYSGSAKVSSPQWGPLYLPFFPKMRAQKCGMEVWTVVHLPIMHIFHFIDFIPAASWPWHVPQDLAFNAAMQLIIGVHYCQCHQNTQICATMVSLPLHHVNLLAWSCNSASVELGHDWDRQA